MTKILPTGQGGLIVTNNRKIYNKIKLVKNHGVVDNFTENGINLDLILNSQIF